ncbi:MAG: hypothetical protein HYZ89_08185 [Candidatus Omnitrophica bacterium]|nr:hypothetical protein [Candidatus Omnitrophota bacterium]
MMKFALRVRFLVAIVMPAPGIASAGVLDKLDEAAQKANEASQQAQRNVQHHQQGTPAPSGGGSLSAGLGATDLHGLTDYNTCMAPISGHQEKLTAEVLQRKLAQSPNLSPQERRNIEADIRWLNATASGARNLPQPDPKQPQRWLLELTDAEQMEINGANSRFANEVHARCEARYGGMSQFGGNGPRRFQANDSVDAPVATAPALPSAPSTREPYNTCTAPRLGLHWKIIADRLERKLAAAGDLSAQERKAWEEDIAVVRTAEQGDAKTMPMSPDPNNPMRYMTRLSPNEQMTVNQEYARANQQLVSSCGSAATGRTLSKTGREADKWRSRRGSRPRVTPTP